MGGEAVLSADVEMFGEVAWFKGEDAGNGGDDVMTASESKMGFMRGD